jgi:hypothetical protein
MAQSIIVVVSLVVAFWHAYNNQLGHTSKIGSKEHTVWCLSALMTPQTAMLSRAMENDNSFVYGIYRVLLKLYLVELQIPKNQLCKICYGKSVVS